MPYVIGIAISLCGQVESGLGQNRFPGTVFHIEIRQNFELQFYFVIWK